VLEETGEFRAGQALEERKPREGVSVRHGAQLAEAPHARERGTAGAATLIGHTLSASSLSWKRTIPATPRSPGTAASNLSDQELSKTGGRTSESGARAVSSTAHFAAISTCVNYLTPSVASTL
jgi:hypothetical protein